MPIDYRGFWKTYYIWIRLDEMPITLSKWKSKFKNKLYYEIVYTISWRIRMLRLQEFDRMTKVSSTRWKIHFGGKFHGRDRIPKKRKPAVAGAVLYDENETENR